MISEYIMHKTHLNLLQHLLLTLRNALYNEFSLFIYLLKCLCFMTEVPLSMAPVPQISPWAP